MMVTLPRLTLVGVCLSLAALGCRGPAGGAADEGPVGATVRAATGLEVSGAWAREARSGGVGGVYLRVRAAQAADHLRGLTYPGAARAEVHRTVRDGDMRRMEALPEGLPVAAGASIALEPGGMHIMLVDLAGPLRAGDTFTLTLRFDAAGDVEVPVAVRANMP